MTHWASSGRAEVPCHPAWPGEEEEEATGLPPRHQSSGPDRLLWKSSQVIPGGRTSPLPSILADNFSVSHHDILITTRPFRPSTLKPASTPQRSNSRPRGPLHITTTMTTTTTPRLLHIDRLETSWLLPCQWPNWQHWTTTGSRWHNSIPNTLRLPPDLPGTAQEGKEEMVAVVVVVVVEEKKKTTVVAALRPRCSLPLLLGDP